MKKVPWYAGLVVAVPLTRGITAAPSDFGGAIANLGVGWVAGLTAGAVGLVYKPLRAAGLTALATAVSFVAYEHIKANQPQTPDFGPQS